MNFISYFRRHTSFAYTKEFKVQLKLFIPFLLGQLCSCLMGTVDMLMAGLAGTEDISGVAVACSFYWPAYMFLAGLAYGITPITSHLLASGENLSLEKRLFNALMVCTIIGVGLALLLALSPLIFLLVPADEKMILVATDYLYFVSLSLPFTVVFNVLRSYSEGLGVTKPTLFFGVLQLILNIPLNYIFIFGMYGMPRLGGVGCGLTSCFINILCAFMIIIYIKKAPVYKKFGINLSIQKLETSLVKAYLKLATPIGISRTLEVACFSLAAVILSPLGPTIVAAHSITLNVSSLIFMIPLSLCMTATIRTASNLGIESFAKAQISLKITTLINLSLFVVYALVLFFFREQIAALYSKDPKVIALASALMLLNCFYLFPDSIQAMLTGVLQGFKDTKIIMLNTTIAYWLIGVPVGFVLAYGYLGLPKLEAFGIWTGFLCALTFSAIVYALRVRYLFKHKVFNKV